MKAFFRKCELSVSGNVSYLFQEMYPDRMLVSPAPAGGNTNWFDPFFQVFVSSILKVILHYDYHYDDDDDNDND